MTIKLWESIFTDRNHEVLCTGPCWHNAESPLAALPIFAHFPLKLSLQQAQYLVSLVGGVTIHLLCGTAEDPPWFPSWDPSSTPFSEAQVASTTIVIAVNMATTPAALAKTSSPAASFRAWTHPARRTGDLRGILHGLFRGSVPLKGFPYTKGLPVYIWSPRWSPQIKGIREAFLCTLPGPLVPLWKLLIFHQMGISRMWRKGFPHGNTSMGLLFLISLDCIREQDNKGYTRASRETLQKRERATH